MGNWESSTLSYDLNLDMQKRQLGVRNANHAPEEYILKTVSDSHFIFKFHYLQFLY